MAISVANFTSNNFRNRHSADVPTAPMNACYWHLANNPTASMFARYWTKADKVKFWSEMVCPLMTRSGQR
jgi:hypothetical protein